MCTFWWGYLPFMVITLGPFSSAAATCDYCFGYFTPTGHAAAGPVVPAFVCMAYPIDGSFTMFCATRASAAVYIQAPGGCRWVKGLDPTDTTLQAGLPTLMSAAVVRPQPYTVAVYVFLRLAEHVIKHCGCDALWPDIWTCHCGYAQMAPWRCIKPPS